MTVSFYGRRLAGTWEPGLTNPQCPLCQEARGERRAQRAAGGGRRGEGTEGYLSKMHLNGHKKTGGYVYANATAPATAALAF